MLFVEIQHKTHVHTHTHSHACTYPHTYTRTHTHSCARTCSHTHTMRTSQGKNSFMCVLHALFSTTKFKFIYLLNIFSCESVAGVILSQPAPLSFVASPIRLCQMPLSSNFNINNLEVTLSIEKFGRGVRECSELLGIKPMPIDR